MGSGSEEEAEQSQQDKKGLSGSPRSVGSAASREADAESDAGVDRRYNNGSPTILARDPVQSNDRTGEAVANISREGLIENTTQSDADKIRQHEGDLHQQQRSDVKSERPPQLLVIRMGEGDVVLTRKEELMYGWLFIIFDSTAKNSISNQQVAAIFPRTGLSQAVLRNVWRIASDGLARPYFSKSQWFLSCRLIAIAQAGNEKLNTELLFEKREENARLADFGLFCAYPDLKPDVSSLYTTSECEVQVTDPKSVGSGMGVHIEYTVTLKTTLKHFPHSKISVTRRYSDFRWLRRNLRRRFPATVLPPLPGKRIFGNLASRFVEERRLALEQFIANVARQPKLSACFEVQVFLDASVQGLSIYRSMLEAFLGKLESNYPDLKTRALEQSRGSARQEENSKTINDDDDGDDASTISSSRRALIRPSTGSLSGNTGPVQWLTRLLRKVESKSVFASSSNAIERALHDTFLRQELERLSIDITEFAETKRQMDSYRKVFQTVIVVTERLLASRRAQGYELARIGAYMAGVGQVDSGSSCANNKSCGEFLHQVSTTFERASNDLQDLNDKVSRQVLSPLRFQLGKMSSVAKVFEGFEDRIRDLEAAHRDIASSKKRFAAARAKNDSVPAAQQAIANAEAHCEQAESMLVDHFHSVELEISIFKRDKAARIREILQALADTEGECSALLQDHLSPLRRLCSNGDDPEALEASANRLASSPLDPSGDLPSQFTRYTSALKAQRIKSYNRMSPRSPKPTERKPASSPSSENLDELFSSEGTDVL